MAMFSESDADRVQREQRARILQREQYLGTTGGVLGGDSCLRERYLRGVHSESDTDALRSKRHPTILQYKPSVGRQQ